MPLDSSPPGYDFKGIGCSKIGYFKEVRSKISELERLNLSLAQRRNRLEAIFNSISDGLTILDRDLNIVYANKVQEQMFSSSSLIGEKCFRAYYRRLAVCQNCPSLKTMASEKTLQGEVLVRRDNSPNCHIEWITSPIRDARGHVAETILLMRDITQRKEYEYKLMQADRMAAIGFLAAGVAHEINNPLTSIAGFSEGLLKRLHKAKQNGGRFDLAGCEEYLNIIQEEAYRCKKIIQNLQAFSRSSGDDFEVLPIDRIIQDTVSLFRQRAKDSHIEIAFDNRLRPGWDTIIGKKGQLKHLFLSLFNHAFLCVESEGRLEVLALVSDDQVEIQILHSGCRHADRYHTTLLDPSCVSQFNTQGQAIDLSICFNIVQHHQGDIHFETREDRLALFKLRIPLHIEQAVDR